MADIGITKFRVQIPRDGATPSTPGFAQSEGQDPVNPPGSPTGIYVPYLGATGGVNLGEFGLTTGNIIFDTTPTNIPTAQGAMYWDADDETVALIMNGAIQKVGEDAFYQVKNQTGSNIAKGVAVRFAGTVGNSGRLLIEPFLADGTYPSTYFMGVTMEAIDNGEDGKVMWFGRIRGINTNAYNESDILYASTTVAGGFQTTVPQAPNNIVEVCAVVTKSTTVGTIFVRPTLGSNINRDEGVKITSPTTGDLLQLQAGGLWENKSLATIIGSSYVPSSRTLTINGTSFDLSANRSWSVGTVTSVGVSVPTGLLVSNTPITGSGTIGISLQTGYSIPTTAKQTEWDTAYTNRITSLTTTGSSGAATLLSNTLNIPNYTLSGLGGVPTNRTLTINGTALDLSENRFWSVGTVTSVGLSSATSGVTIGSTPVTGSGTITLAIATASGSQQGLLSSTDWSTFNNKQNALTNPVTGTGTLNYLSKFTSTGSAIGNSQIFDDGTNVGIGLNNPSQKLEIGSSGQTVFRIRSGNVTNGGGAVYIQQAGTTTTHAAFGDSASIVGGTPNQSVSIWTNSTPLLFYVNGSEQSRITTAGNWLLGTTTDNGAKFQVNGGATVAGNIILDSSADRFVGFGTSTTKPFIEFNTLDNIVINAKSNGLISFELNGVQVGRFNNAEMYAKSILTNSTINRTAKNWKLGDARTDTIPNANRLIRVEIDGVEYDILCREVI